MGVRACGYGWDYIPEFLIFVAGTINRSFTKRLYHKRYKILMSLGDKHWQNMYKKKKIAVIKFTVSIC